MRWILTLYALGCFIGCGGGGSLITLEGNSDLALTGIDAYGFFVKVDPLESVDRLKIDASINEDVVVLTGKCSVRNIGARRLRLETMRGVSDAVPVWFDVQRGAVLSPAEEIAVGYKVYVSWHRVPSDKPLMTGCDGIEEYVQDILLPIKVDNVLQVDFTYLDGADDNTVHQQSLMWITFDKKGLKSVECTEK